MSSFLFRSGNGRLWIVPHISRSKMPSDVISADSARPSHVSGNPPEMTPLTRRDPDHTLHATPQQVRCQQLRRLQAAGQRNSLIINLVYQLPTLFLTKRHSILVSSFRIIYHQLFAGNRHESAMAMGSSVV